MPNVAVAADSTASIPEPLIDSLRIRWVPYHGSAWKRAPRYPLGTARSRQQAYQRMVDMIEGAVGRAARIKVAYVHAAGQAEAERIRSLVEAPIDCAESLVAELSPALGVHSGPRTAGVCYTAEPA